MLSVADKWLAELLNILENTGVANETLVVIWGISKYQVLPNIHFLNKPNRDSGVSLPENSGVTPYLNPRTASFHIPLVFAHPPTTIHRDQLSSSFNSNPPHNSRYYMGTWISQQINKIRYPKSSPHVQRLTSTL